MSAASPLEIQLHTPLSPTECEARLAPLVDATRWPFSQWINLTGVRCVIGRVTDRTLLVRRRGSPLTGLQGVLQGTFTPTGDGTLIAGKMVWLPQIWIYVVGLWIFTFVTGMMFLVSIGTLLAAGGGSSNGWSGVAILGGMLAVCIAMQVLARKSLRKDAAFFRELFVRKCEAVLPDSPGSAKS